MRTIWAVPTFVWMRILAGLLVALTLAACSENETTGRRQFVVVDDAQLVQLADNTWGEVVAKAPPVRDPALQARLARVASKVAATTGRTDLNWEFAVLESDDINAFVLPNGKVGVFRGLMDLTGGDDAQLAAVLGHEVGHVISRHAAERVSQEMAVQLGVSLAQAALGGDNGENAGVVAGALGMGALFGVILPYSRKHELEADRVGVELMRRAGYDPAAAVTFFERMAQASAGKPKPPEIFSTHPADQGRLEALRQVVAASQGG